MEISRNSVSVFQTHVRIQSIDLDSKIEDGLTKHSLTLYNVVDKSIIIYKNFHLLNRYVCGPTVINSQQADYTRRQRQTLSAFTVFLFFLILFHTLNSGMLSNSIATKTETTCN